MVFGVDVNLPRFLYRALGFRDDVLDLRRENYDAPHLKHIVIAPDDAADFGQT
jgi:hypothetical protein